MTECIKDIRLEGIIPCTAVRREASAVHGVIVVDKPAGMTSFGVVGKIKKLLRLKKVGHCGTLDPFATGVLLICVNQATRIAEHLSTQDKTYACTLQLGAETDTLDRTGSVIRAYEGPPCSEADLLGVVNEFKGSYQQQVPRYAAVKVQGRRLYEWARRGVEVDLPIREVHIHEIRLLGFHWPEVSLEVCCSKGTYIRQLAADMGRALGCGAHVKDLRRMASGPFHIDQAMSLHDLEAACGSEKWQAKVITINEALAHLPAVFLDNKILVEHLYNGQLDSDWESNQRKSFPNQKEPVRILTRENRLIALWWPQPHLSDPDRCRCLKVFK